MAAAVSLGHAESEPLIELAGVSKDYDSGAGIVRDMRSGEAFSTGLAFCVTGGGTSTDNTNAAVGVFISLLYK